MESNSLTRDILIDQIRDAYARLTYSQLCHVVQGNLFKKRRDLIKTLQAVLSALTTGSLIPVIFGKNQNLFAIFSAILSVLLSILNIYFKEHDLGDLANQHKIAGNKLWRIKEDYRSLLCDLQTEEVSIENARIKRDNLNHCISTIYSESPTTSQKAYRLAKQSIQKEEATFFSDSEIDIMLPIGMRKCRSENHQISANHRP